MKSLLFATFVLSLILIVVSAQCNLNDLSTCFQNYLNTVPGAGSDRATMERFFREYCQSTCATTTLIACNDTLPSLGLDLATQGFVESTVIGCSVLPSSAGSAYSVFALLSSVILVGVAAVFY